MKMITVSQHLSNMSAFTQCVVWDYEVGVAPSKNQQYQSKKKNWDTKNLSKWLDAGPW